MTLPAALAFAPEVADALATGRPVVALESTIITHGMPHPQNLAMAEGVEAVIREGGAVPATIAVLDGTVKVGLSPDERAALAAAPAPRKVSRADLAFAVARGETAGTTVAATMMIAALAGIGVFATGGIGGVHRGAEETFDISADLLELARTPVIVVAAGAKAILDIGKTLEVLETHGVPVVGYRTDTMPAFWSRTSAFAAPLRLDSAADIAAFQHARVELGVEGGMLVANPIPPEHEIPAGEMARHIARAQAEMEAAGISGKAVTPYLLGRIVELTAGASLASNIALVKSNAALAAEIAHALIAR